MVALLAWLLLVVWTEKFHGMRQIDSSLGGVRAALYGALATIDAARIGFIIATAAIVLSFAQGEKVRTVASERAV